MLSVAYSEEKTQQDNSQLIIPYSKEAAYLHQNLTNVSYFGNWDQFMLITVLMILLFI